MTELPSNQPQYEELQDIRSSLEQPRKKPSRLWIGLGIVAVVLLVVAAIIQTLTPRTVRIPETPFVVTNSNNTLPNLTEVSYSGPTPDFPTQFSVYAVTQTLPEQVVVGDMLAKYGLMKPRNDANYWINGPISLIQDTSPPMYTLVLKDPENEALPVINIEQARLVASRFMQDTFPEFQFSLIPGSEGYFILSTEPGGPVPPEQATGVTLSFTPTLETENLPIFYDKSFEPPFIVTVDGNNTIRTLRFSPLFKQYTKVDTQNVLSLDDALTQIESGVASIISATIEDMNRVSMSELTAATFSSVGLEYRQDPNFDVLYPFFHFYGTGTSSNGVTAEIEVITPAVKLTGFQR
ncbi:hypothetical protein H3C66_00135 [Patescibacteria group bacterium]|nr:hypothetical protein [Patescibacteria group bacterium]